MKVFTTKAHKGNQKGTQRVRMKTKLLVRLSEILSVLCGKKQILGEIYSSIKTPLATNVYSYFDSVIAATSSSLWPSSRA